MSIGVVVSNQNFQMVEAVYFVLMPECTVGGIFQDALFLVPKEKCSVCDRPAAINDVVQFLAEHNVDSIFAYNATFDYHCLPELSSYLWFDIMRVASHKQFNHAIPDDAPLYSTGKLKRGYGVEPILRMLTGNPNYLETHNALLDAFDELQIMRLLGHGLDVYSQLN